VLALVQQSDKSFVRFFERTQFATFLERELSEGAVVSVRCEEDVVAIGSQDEIIAV
jgi:hypothetical protein